METLPNNFHLSSESLEEYVLGRMPASEAARVSEHLFECDSCHQRYDEEVKLLIDLRGASPGLRENAAVLPFWSRITAMPGPLLAGASAVAVIILLVPRLSESPSSPAFTELATFRNAGSVTAAPANRTLVLRLDTTGLEQSSQFQTELADSTGQRMWSGAAVQKDGRWEVSIDKRLAPGQYWVRLYAGEQGELLREFSLQLK
jgi:hypothetical protein